MITKLQDTAQNFRQQIKNKQIDLYQQSAHALRLEMLQHDPNYPVYHFAPPEGWMNDPNGLIFYHNQYHLFYQYGPTLPDECVFHAANQTYPNRHGQMTWGHAVSEDLFHWRDLPIAMWPDQTFDCKGVYSGNMAVAPDGTPCALYTGNVRGHEETYGVLAIPQDELLNQWNKQVVMDAPPYEGTPTHWDAQIWKHGDLYYQLCGGCINGHGAANLYTSEDLLHWTFASTIYEHTHAAFWELPYLLELDGKHLLLVGAVGANCRNPYWIGHFDYSTLKFTPDHTEPLVSDTGTYYSYNPSMVDKTGRRIMFGWVTGPASSCTAVPYWQGLHSIPREIYLKNGILCQQPVPEIEALKHSKTELGNTYIQSNSPVEIPETGDAYELQFNLPGGKLTEPLVLHFLAGTSDVASLTIDPIGTVSFHGFSDVQTEAMFHPQCNTRFRIFADRSVFEIYAEELCKDGQRPVSRVMTGRCLLEESATLNGVNLSGSVTLSDVRLEKIHCIWS